MDRDRRMIDSLLHERAGYLRTGKVDRAALVEAELRKQGYEVKPERPVGRSARPVETAEPSEPAETVAEPQVESVEEKPAKRRGRPRYKRDENGQVLRDENGNGIPE